MKKTKSYYKINDNDNDNNNDIFLYIYYNKLLKIIPNTDAISKDLIINIINCHKNSKLICYNPLCNNKLGKKIYCIYDSYYCCNECKLYIKDNIIIYWDHLFSKT